MKYIIVYLLLSMIVHTVTCVDVCQLSKQLKSHIITHRMYSNNVAYRINERYERCAKIEQTRENEKRLLMVVGTILGGLIFTPAVIGPMFAAKSLYGAAAISNGMANLGLGSLVSGGFGMFGGGLVLNAAKIGFGAALNKLGDSAYGDCLRESIRMVDVSGVYYDTLVYDTGYLLYEGDFLNMLPHGNGRLYTGKNVRIFEGKFNYGIPVIC